MTGTCVLILPLPFGMRKGNQVRVQTMDRHLIKLSCFRLFFVSVIQHLGIADHPLFA